MLFHIAHSNPMAGHLGVNKTLARLMACVFCLGNYTDVGRCCTSCHECQLVNPPATPNMPLRPLSLIWTSFKELAWIYSDY